MRKKNFKIDLTSHFLKNTYIFKENLKIIMNSISRLTSREIMVIEGGGEQFVRNFKDGSLLIF